MRYRSKKDIAVVAILWVGLLIPFALGISSLFNPSMPKVAGWFLITLGIVIVGLLLLLTYPLYYEITPTTLLVRSGVFRVKIPLDSIQEVFPERYLGNAPAWSVDRLRVNYRTRWGTRWVHIAPKDKGAFMQDLVVHAQGLVVQEGRVIRRQ